MKKKIINCLLLILVGVSFLVFAVGSGTNVTTSTSGSSGSTANLKTYNLNDDIYVKGSTGEYRVKFTKIYETKERNEFSDKTAKKVIIIEYEYENVSKEDDLYVDEMHFKLYDKENNQLETYPVSTKYGSRVSKGRKTSASQAYALNSDNNYIELEFYDNMFNSKPDCKVVFEW